MNCKFNKGVCTSCGYELPNGFLDKTVRYCLKHRSGALGDQTETLFKSLGITKARYIEFKKLFGLAPTCSCEKRKEWLNKISNYLS